MGIRDPKPRRLERGEPEATRRRGEESATGVCAWFLLALFGLPRGPIGWVGARLLPFLAGRWYALMVDELGLQPDDELLDVGCGSGGLLAEAGVARSVAGLDASVIQLGLARRRLADRLAAGTAQLVLGDAAALPWDGERFSAVTCLNTLKFLPDPDQGLREMLRVLRPGGRALIMVDPPAEDHGRSGARDAFGQPLRTEGEVRIMMSRAGFSRVSVGQLRARRFRMQLVRAVKPA